MRIEELTDAADDLDLARLRHATESARQLADDLVLPRAELVEVDLRRAERDAVLGEHLRLVHHRGDVQERLRRNAADVEAHAAQRKVALHQHGLLAEVGRAECSAVATRPGTKDEHLAFDVRLAGVGGGSRNRRRRGCRGRGLWGWGGSRGCRGGRGCRFRGGVCCLEHDDRRAFADLVADLHENLFNLARGWRGHVHRRLVRLERDERILGGDGVARFHEDLDDRDVLEVSDVRDLDLDRAHTTPTLAASLKNSAAAPEFAPWDGPALIASPGACRPGGRRDKP